MSTEREPITAGSRRVLDLCLWCGADLKKGRIEGDRRLCSVDCRRQWYRAHS